MAKNSVAMRVYDTPPPEQCRKDALKNFGIGPRKTAEVPTCLVPLPPRQPQVFSRTNPNPFISAVNVHDRIPLIPVPEYDDYFEENDFKLIDSMVATQKAKAPAVAPVQTIIDLRGNTGNITLNFGSVLANPIVLQ